MPRCMFTGADLPMDDVHAVYYFNGADVRLDGYVDKNVADEYTFVCSDCGRRFSKGGMYVIMPEETNIHLCGYCMNEGAERGDYRFCNECDNWYRAYDVYVDPSDRHVCRYCYNSGDFIDCDCCGRMIHSDEAVYNEDGIPLCRHCRPANYIKRYHYKPSPKFHAATGEDPRGRYFGVELEVDRGDVNNCSRKLHDIDPDEEWFYQKHDGSLSDSGEGGIEIVTHPFTLLGHKTEMPWEKVANVCLEHHFKSNDTSTCGLHVHVSRDAFGMNQDMADLNIAKVLLIFDRFWDQIVKFSRRKYEALERWAKKAPEKYYDDENEDDVTEKMRGYQDNGDRYTAVNLCNEDTVEFRVFKGTLKVSTIYATLQWIYNLISFVTENNLMKVQSATWLEIAKYNQFDELNAYLAERELDTDVTPVKLVRPRVNVVRCRLDCVPFANGHIDNDALIITREPLAEEELYGTFGIVRNGRLAEIRTDVEVTRFNDKWRMRKYGDGDTIVTDSELAILDFNDVPAMMDTLPNWVVYNGQIVQAKNYFYRNFVISTVTIGDEVLYLTQRDVDRKASRQNIINKMIELPDEYIARTDAKSKYGVVLDIVGDQLGVIIVGNDGEARLTYINTRIYPMRLVDAHNVAFDEFYGKIQSYQDSYINTCVKNMKRYRMANLPF